VTNDCFLMCFKIDIQAIKIIVAINAKEATGIIGDEGYVTRILKLFQTKFIITFHIIKIIA